MDDNEDDEDDEEKKERYKMLAEDDNLSLSWLKNFLLLSLAGSSQLYFLVVGVGKVLVIIIYVLGQKASSEFK